VEIGIAIVDMTTEAGTIIATSGRAPTAPGRHGESAARIQAVTVIEAASGVAVAVVAASRHGTRDEIAARSHGIKAVLGGPGAKRAVVATSTRSGKIVVNEPTPWTGNQDVAAAPRRGDEAKATATELAAPSGNNVVMGQPGHASGLAAEVAQTITRAHYADQALQQLQPASAQ